jgi:hypothetical protein
MIVDAELRQPLPEFFEAKTALADGRILPVRHKMQRKDEVISATVKAPSRDTRRGRMATRIAPMSGQKMRLLRM